LGQIALDRAYARSSGAQPCRQGSEFLHFAVAEYGLSVALWSREKAALYRWWDNLGE
jgi:hypothetical protein